MVLKFGLLQSSFSELQPYLHVCPKSASTEWSSPVRVDVCHLALSLLSVAQREALL